jgi:energy-coupling factor transporter ATP-binding protein EcfA2
MENLVETKKSVNDLENILNSKLMNKDFPITEEDTIDLIIHCINKNQINLKNSKNQEILIFVGNTGSGKSTTVNYLFGCTMTVKQYEDILSDEVIEVLPKSLGGALDEVVKIGHTNVSETFLPSINLNNYINLAVMDCPGFFDNRGSEINISNAVNIRNIIHNLKNVKIALVMNYKSLLIDRASCFDILIKNCVQLFGNENNILNNIDSLLLIITNFPLEKKLSKIKKFFQNDQNQVIQKLADCIITYDPLEREMKEGLKREKIYEKIKSLKFINNSKQFFQTNLNPTDLMKLDKISDFSLNKIKLYISNQNYPECSAVYKRIKSLQIINHLHINKVIDTSKQLIIAKLKETENEIRNFYLSNKFLESQNKMANLQNILNNFCSEISSQFNFIDMKNKLEEQKRKFEEQERIRIEKENEEKRLREERERQQRLRQEEEERKRQMAEQERIRLAEIERQRIIALQVAEQNRLEQERIRQQQEAIRLENERQQLLIAEAQRLEQIRLQQYYAEVERQRQIQIQIDNANRRRRKRGCVIF